MSTVIKIEDLSKQYRLGQVGTGSFAHDVNRVWHKLRGNDDPYLKVGDLNDRTAKASSEYVWALKDINLQVRQGEVLGIIGRNGAGKSTLLKILSKTTRPTTGRVKIKGRIASLLEVGTGFHPELSGRENIYLNGAILGMTRHEIKTKFDEIVDFAGVERYIDTPVKRYSSGMYVRLAFGVAAHLEPEILIVDEVLAVGDAEFQKKALGKMKDVSGRDGRTVLFVSHNMEAIVKLCSGVLILENGSMGFCGNTDEALRYYFQGSENTKVRYLNDEKKIARIELHGAETSGNFLISKSWHLDILLNKMQSDRKIILSIDFLADDGKIINSSRFFHDNINAESQISLKCLIPKNFFNVGVYSISAYLTSGDSQMLHSLPEVLTFNTAEVREEDYLGKINGVIRYPFEWVLGE